MYKPPYRLTPDILNLLTSLSEKIGQAAALHLEKPPAALRKSNRVKTIHSSLNIEGNSLSLEQVTAIVEKKRVAGPKKDIVEVQNAIEVYEKIKTFQAFSQSSLLDAHSVFMKGLLPKAGKFRTTGVGIVKGNEMAHIPPPGANVKGLLTDLFSYIKTDPDPILIRACVFHYELEFIHPFMDGNGRIGRFWQTLLLMQEYTLFEFLPIDGLIKNEQENYYRALSASDKSGEATPFIHFMLGLINHALANLLQTSSAPKTMEDRIDLYKEKKKGHSFTRKDYLVVFKALSTATASRDLKEAVNNGILKKQGDKRLTVYRFI